MSIKETEGGKLAVDVTINIGDSWGKESLAKELAKHVMERLYQSKLPVSHVVVRIFSYETNLLVLALGENQAEKIHWHAFKTGQDFVDHVKSNHSRISGVKAAADAAFVLESPSISRPSPLLKGEE